MSTEEGISSSSSEGSDNIQSHNYDVFLSFRGSDTRNSFVDHLYAYLVRKGISAFKDDKQLQKGESISPQLLRAIQNSRVSVVVFSKDYASSSWCLDEMAAIDESRINLKQVVFPVFYDVDPSHVRHQGGEYEKAFVLHCKTFKHDSSKVNRWKTSLTCLACLAGWDVRNKPQFEIIEKMVEAIIEKLGRKFSEYVDDLVGIQPHIEELESLLKLRSESDDDDGCQVLGIWGMDGIGKTTLATVLYDRISYQFDVSCFIENVSKSYEEGGVVAVQTQILCRTIQEKNLDRYGPPEISQIMRNGLNKTKLLIVLDNVEQLEQLEELHMKPKLLHKKSRIIIVTRDKHILQAYGADEIFKAKLMKDKDAHKLLCRKAFKRDYPKSGFADLIPEVLIYAQNLPLAVRIIGSSLFLRNARQWSSTLDKFEKNPPNKIMKALHISYEGLEKDEKQVFLHVACFFKEERKDYVSRILHACGLNPDTDIPLLVEKSLITIRNEEIHMHEMLHKLGMQIVQEQHPYEPKLWSRLWCYRDFHDAMITNSEAIKAKAIILNPRENISKFKKLRAEDLSKMENLEVLILYHTKFSGSPLSLSDSLCYILWNGYPFTSLPDFQPHNLVELNMPDSNIEQLWIGIQYLPSLKRMDLSNSKNLKVTPCFEGMTNLVRLDFTGCINLVEVNPSIGLLTELVFLSLQKCSGLVNLDFGNASRLKSLRVLCLSDCTKLRGTPDFNGSLILQYLDMDRCASLSTIHESVGALEKLRFLSLRDCTNLVELPDIFHKMTSLITLDLTRCCKMTKLPLRWSSNLAVQALIYLDFSFCSISNIPDAIGELRWLEGLDLQGNDFTTLPSTLWGIRKLSYLNVSHCHKLRSLPELPKPNSPDSSGIYYFGTRSRNYRSGLYIFDSPNCNVPEPSFGNENLYILFNQWVLPRLVQERFYSLSGFDIVFPWQKNPNGSPRSPTPDFDIVFPWQKNPNRSPRSPTPDFDIVFPWQKNPNRPPRSPTPDFDKVPNNIPALFHRWFKGESIVRICDTDMRGDWIGFLFFVKFKAKNDHVVSTSPLSSGPLPHPFYLSFESEHTEERFDMSLNLERSTVHGNHYLWIIYISRAHCHFVETGAHITFKARKGLIIKEWSLRKLTKKDTEGSTMKQSEYIPLETILKTKESINKNNLEPKIQLPYNWLVSDEDEAENNAAKRKETELFNLGFFTE